MLYKTRNDVIKYFDDYSSMVSMEANHEAIKGTGLKILSQHKYRNGYYIYEL